MSAAALALELLLAALCILWIIGAFLGLRVLRTVPALWLPLQPGHTPPPLPVPGVPASADAPAAPFLSILIPANNEAGDETSIADLRAAHASRLAAARALVEAAPGLTTELVYIDDRSTDATGAVLDTFVAAAQLSVAVRKLHIRELPEGWLGKTYALHRALATIPASCGWVLLTDADVRLAPDALRLALGHAHECGLDHLVLMPQLHAGGLLRDATLGAFGRIFALNLASVNNPKSKASVGIGAFNLVRRAALTRIGDMQRVRLEVADDMALGAMLRAEGARQGVASGRELVQLTWYRTAGQLVRGLEKGIFAYGGRCEPWRLYLGGLALAIMELAPWVALVYGAAGAAGDGSEAVWPRVSLWLLGATAIVLGIGVVALGERWMGRRALPALFVPIGGLIMAWAAVRAGWVGARRGGVVWRGTLYPSEMLREAMSWESGTRGGRKRQQ